MPNGAMPGARDWRKLTRRQRAALLTTIRRLGEEGVVENDERFKLERDKIFAIKAWKVRVYCFMTADQRIVLANIAEKKQDKAKGKDIERAKRVRKECTNG
jgi:hypothetical protein